MQAPQSNPAVKKQRSPGSFFAELSAAATAAAEVVTAADAATPADTVSTADSGTTADRASPGTPQPKPGRDREGSAAGEAPESDAGAGASVTDRRSTSRRADDVPASNPPDRAWIRPGWMTGGLDHSASERRLPEQVGARELARPEGPAQPPGRTLSTEAGPRVGQTAQRSQRSAMPVKSERSGRSESTVAEDEPRGTGGAGLAHDAANLLAALMLYSELLSFPDVLPERYRHYADDLKLVAERSRTLIDRLVAFGGSVDGEQAIGTGQVSLVDVLMHCEGLLWTLTRGALQVTFGAQAALPVAIAPEPLERILVNLVKNATLATKNGGAVRIGVGLLKNARNPPVKAGEAPAPGGLKSGTQRGARIMVLTVDDSGCGMTEQEIARVLHTEAIRNPEAPEPGRRQGIGLRVVRELVLASGGKLGIESRVGVGTRIEIQWPVAEGESAEAPEPRATSSGVEVSGTVRRMEMVADPREPTSLTCFSDTAELAVGLSAAERRLLSEQRSRPGKRAVSCGSAEFNRFTNDSKGAIAC